MLGMQDDFCGSGEDNLYDGMSSSFFPSGRYKKPFVFKTSSKVPLFYQTFKNISEAKGLAITILRGFPGKFLLVGSRLT
jgi:hypothetical protein